MDRLEAMTVLVAAADTGSLSAASRQLRIPLATVSRRMSELEAHLNVRLFRRGQRRIVLTEAGRDYVASCRQILEEITEAERIAAGEYRAPQGELIITAPAVMGRSHVLPVIEEFLEAYPDISIRLQLTDRHVNFVEEHVDLAVRIGELADSSNLIAARVGTIRVILCASPTYLKRRGVPKKPKDLEKHDCVVHEGHPTARHWQFFGDGPTQTIAVKSRLSVSLAEAAVAAALDGVGIARVLSYLIDDLVRAGALTPVLENYEPAPIAASVIYLSQRQTPLKLRVFLDFAIPRLKERLGYRNAPDAGESCR
ncbi:MAG: LysR family transcriptional regulator [Parvibaculum sp.]|uniref:LysR family transcriptional regulator n=1 Tax=Parvibaculum sp. TaxID=2024848 RepID=UPI002840DB76|nr:LysR family transcriptional regulator [Parvibaculum sp.]MDR3500148.1 LysR family transcriptional regulator [Parvibaculum sp.]